jgi:hypothetical protein
MKKVKEVYKMLTLFPVPIGGYITLIMSFLMPIFIFMSFFKFIMKKAVFFLLLFFLLISFKNNEYIIYAVNIVKSNLYLLPTVFFIYVIFGIFRGTLKLVFSILTGLFYLILFFVVIGFLLSIFPMFFSVFV